MSELIINGRDALVEFGVRMGDGFIDAIDEPVPIKDFIENKSRLQNGKQVIHSNPKVDERDITLVFNLEGTTQDDYALKKNKFKAELQKGLVVISVPAIGETYRLTYRKSVVFSVNTDRTFSKISIKFNEPNPNLRG